MMAVMQTAAVLDLRVELSQRESTTDTSASVLPLDFDWSLLGEKAEGGFEVLRGALRRRFVVPAVQAGSSEEFWALWANTSAHVLDIVLAMATLVHEATSDAGPPSIVQTQLVRGDRRAADDLAHKAEHSGRVEFAGRLRAVNALMSRARTCVAERIAQDSWVSSRSFFEYRHGNFLWAVGMELLAECIGEWLPHHEPRAGLLEDCSKLTEDGSRVAAISALELCDVEFQGEDEDWWKSLFERVETFNFLLEALHRVRLLFGTSVTITIVHFIEPDFPDSSVAHFVIETELEPEQACDRLDELCDQWWDSAIEDVGVVIHPVLDVAR